MTKEQAKKAIKLYKSLNCPSETLDILGEIIPHQKAWNMVLSDRARGKTTNLLLWGMCLNAVSGIQIQYIRQRETQLSPKNSADLFTTITKPEYKYIEKITGGKYNNVYYYGRRWYYQLNDENGNVIDRSKNPFMVSLAVSLNEDYKSNYNAPDGDFIIYDEFLSRQGYLQDEFVKLCDLLSTIIRNRDTATIYLCANLVDKYSIYFDELQLNDIIAEIQRGEHRFLNCDETQLHIFMMNISDSKAKQKVNKFYFGWQNPQLTAITGLNGMWAMKMYPKAPKGKYTILNKAYIFKNGKYVCREIRKDNESGLLYLYLYNNDFGYNSDKHILYRIDSPCGYNQKIRYGLGYSKTDQFIKKLIQHNRVFYANNSCGAFLESYIRDM